MQVKTAGQMSQGISLQLCCPSVILTAPVDPEKVIEFAYSIKAITDEESALDEPPTLVIDFRYDGEGHGADEGAKLYAEAALRTQLDRDLSAATV